MRQELDTKDELGFERDGADEDVDGDCPLPMRGALVMMMAMISPSGREVSPATAPEKGLDNPQV